MSDFTNFDDFELIHNSRTVYHLTKPMRYEIASEGSGWWLDVAAGTKFDISVPRWLEWLQSPHDRRVLLAAAIHDELGVREYDIAFSSGEMRRAMAARGASPVRAWTVFFVTLVYTGIWRMVNWGNLDKA